MKHIDIRKGKAYIKGTRFPMAQLIQELADRNHDLENMCLDFDMDYDKARNALNELDQFLTGEIQWSHS